MRRNRAGLYRLGVDLVCHDVFALRAFPRIVADFGRKRLAPKLPEIVRNQGHRMRDNFIALNCVRKYAASYNFIRLKIGTNKF